jgi:vancomycin aglycone glucosyltransferase
MRVLVSTIGSRGDVQPLVALALRLRALGQEAHLCVPPDVAARARAVAAMVRDDGAQAAAQRLMAAVPQKNGT